MAEPPITIRAAHDSGTPNLPPTRYVVHCTAGGRGYPRESAAGTATATARYFTTPAAGGSAHYIHDAGGGEEHCVPEDVIAWHAPPNPESIGDEICGEPTYTREQWLSDEVWPAVQASAVRCREVCDRRGIPKVKLTPADLLAGKSGICGHVDVSNAWHQSTHWDPGPNFPWDKFMAEVLGQSQPEGFMAGLTDAEQRRVLAAADRFASNVAPAVGRIELGIYALRHPQPGTDQQDPAALADAIVTALPKDLAQQVVDALVARLKSS